MSGQGIRGPVVAPARLRVSLACGSFNDCGACRISWCEHGCHGALIARREVPGAVTVT
jgi:hypothetical protein